MILPWYPVILTDAIGSVCVLALALACLAISLQWYRRRLWDLFRHYLFFFTLSLVIFAVSRSGGHLVKQVLIATGNSGIWHMLAPFTGAVNTVTFVIIFAISMYSRRIGLAHREITSYQNDLENLVEKRTRLLDEQLEFQKQLLDAVPIPVFFTDAEGRIMGANASFVDMFNCRGEDIYGKAPEKTDCLRTCLPFLDLRVAGGDSVMKKEESVNCHDGARRELILYASPFSGAGGAVGGFIGAIIDITERKKLEDYILQSEKIETVATMAGGIAHEFNNILAAIMGFAELAACRVTADPDVSHDLEQILISSRRARDLVRQMLVFSRQKSLNREPCDMNAIITQAASLLRHRLGPGMEIETELCGGAMVMADPGHMQQVFLNLGHNGIKAMEERGGVLSISCGPVVFPDRDIPGSDRMEPGQYVRIRVSDQGVGIEEGVLKRIFDPFFSTRGVSVASGLGLSVVHGIIKNHDGMIRVDSTPGKGTTFEVFLPVIHAAGVKTYERDEKAAEPCEGGTILLVDDEQSVADMLAIMIERLGFEVETCYDARDALERFMARPGQFVLAFMDEVMPAMHGTELARKLREKRPDIPVVICSGYSGEEVDMPGEVDVWLRKPVAIADLERVLRSLLPS